MDSQDWEALVAEGRRLAQSPPLDRDRYRWLFGDLSLRAVRPGLSREEKSSAQRRLQAFASEVAVEFSFLKDCWYTSAAWPTITRISGISHAKHSRYRGRPNRTELLLNEEMDDGLSSERLRDRVHRAEELLAEKDVRAALLDRSTKRSARIVAAARALENEDDLKARIWARAEQENSKAELAGPEIRAALAERFIKANSGLGRMTSELVDLRQVIAQVPEAYRERTVNSLKQVESAVARLLQDLQPEPREAQLRTVIDHDDQSGRRESATG